MNKNVQNVSRRENILMHDIPLYLLRTEAKQFNKLIFTLPPPLLVQLFYLYHVLHSTVGPFFKILYLYLTIVKIVALCQSSYLLGLGYLVLWPSYKLFIDTYSKIEWKHSLVNSVFIVFVNLICDTPFTHTFSEQAGPNQGWFQ